MIENSIDKLLAITNKSSPIKQRTWHGFHLAHQHVGTGDLCGTKQGPYHQAIILKGWYTYFGRFNIQSILKYFKHTTINYNYYTMKIIKTQS